MVMSMLCCINMAFQRSGPVKARFVNMGAGNFDLFFGGGEGATVQLDEVLWNDCRVAVRLSIF